MTKPLITIKDWETGIAQSPFLGFGDMRNLDTDSIPGSVRLGFLATKQSGTNVNELVTFLAANPTDATKIYGIDAAQDFYSTSNSGSTWSTLDTSETGGTGNGLIVWKDYVFIFKNTDITLYGPLSSSPALRTAWNTGMTSDKWHTAFIGSDDKLYFCNNRYVGSIAENSGKTFTWNDATTYTVTQQALVLPSGVRARCISQLGDDLLIGTTKGTNVYDFKFANIYIWNKTATSFNRPLQLAENGIHAMITVDGLTYFIAGTESKLYVTNKTSVKLLTKIPRHVRNLDSGVYLEVFPGSMMYHNGKVMWGLNGSGSQNNIGIFAYDVATGALSIPILPSASGTVYGIGGMISTEREGCLFAWKDSTPAYGIDSNLGVTTYYRKPSGAYFESPMYSVGSQNEQTSTSSIEVEFFQPLASGQGITLEYRTNSSASYSSITSITNTTHPSKLVVNYPFVIRNAQQIQIKGTLTTGSSQTVSPIVKEIRLYG